MEIVGAVLLVAFVKKLVDWGRFITEGQWRDVVLQVAAWLAGFLAIFLFANTPWADGISIANQAISDMGIAAMLVAGFLISSGASIVHDGYEAVVHRGGVV